MRNIHKLLAIMAFLFIAPLVLANEGSRGLSSIEINTPTSPRLESIELSFHHPIFSSSDLSIKRQSKYHADIELGLGTSQEPLIELKSRMTEAPNFKVYYRTVNVVSLQNEGPHLDLINWKPHYGEWRMVEPIDASRFQLNVVITSDFPAFNKDDLLNAVNKASRKLDSDGSWLTQAKQCNSADDYPCSVVTSKVIVKVMELIEGKWKCIYYINFELPMGC